MNIEQAIDILKNSIADYVIGEYCEKCADNKICDDRNEDCYYQQAIDTVVTAYEKEKEKNKKIDEFCRKELAFERRLKRENREPDEFNQGRFYVSENIRKIIEEE